MNEFSSPLLAVIHGSPSLTRGSKDCDSTIAQLLLLMTESTWPRFPAPHESPSQNPSSADATLASVPCSDLAAAGPDPSQLQAVPMTEST